MGKGADMSAVTVLYGNMEDAELQGGRAVYPSRDEAYTAITDSFLKGQAKYELYVIKSIKGDTGMAKEKKQKSEGRKPPLAPFVSGPFKIYGSYKGKEIEAQVLSSGMIKMNNKEYATPSAATRAITKNAVDGWIFWKYNKDGKRVILDEIRGAKSPLECLDKAAAKHAAKPKAKKAAKPAKKAAPKARKTHGNGKKTQDAPVSEPEVQENDIPQDAAAV